ncbi:MAG: putative manganese transporter [Pseudomonadota bacterium]
MTGMGSLLLQVLLEAVKITSLVLAMMVLVDLANVAAKGRFRTAIQGGVWRQYLLASFLGATPGCLGAFVTVSLYAHGGLSFGALVAGMIATAGDEQFVMLAMFPGQALALFALLFATGLLFGWLADRLASRVHLRPSPKCGLEAYHPQEESGRHYLRHHLWEHLVRRHLGRVFLWTFGTLLVLQLGLHWWDLKGFVGGHMTWVWMLSGLVGIIPESGPHLAFVMLYAQGLVPFSVLFTSSFVQDGHGLLPLLSCSVRDAVLLKGFVLACGLALGGALYGLGW